MKTELQIPVPLYASKEAYESAREILNRAAVIIWVAAEVAQSDGHENTARSLRETRRDLLDLIRGVNIYPSTS